MKEPPLITEALSAQIMDLVQPLGGAIDVLAPYADL